MRHVFNFDGGDYLTTMGAVWFVSYSWYIFMDRGHQNWKLVSTYQNRMSVYNRTIVYHRYWMEKIVGMDIARLETNKLGLSGLEVIEMATKLIDKLSIQ